MNKFAQLKKQSKTSVQELQAKLEELNKKNRSFDDPRYWKITKDQLGNGQAIIRFLPAPDGDDLPFVKLIEYSFQNAETGLYYMENSPLTIGKPDPVQEYNAPLWAADEKDEARKQRKKTSYISNIYVIKDPDHPENEGKVFLFKYGIKIYEKINSLSHPEFEGEEAINPFDLWEGANFRIKVKNVSGYPNYDASSFDKKSALLADDSALETVWNSEYSLKAEVAEDKFKSYDVLKEKLNKVLGRSTNSSTPKSPKNAINEVLEKMEEVSDDLETSSTEDEDIENFFSKHKKKA